MLSGLLKSLLFYFLYLSVIAAQVNVSIPDTSGTTDHDIIIPIYVSNLSNERIRSYKFNLIYDQSILKFRSVVKENTISDIWSWDIDVDLEDDGLEVKADGWFRLSGGGILLKLKFGIRGEKGTTELKFKSFKFNSGKPKAETIDGSFTIYAEKMISFSKQGDGQGKISVNGVKYDLPQEVNIMLDQTVTLKAEPNSNSVFNGWYGGLISSNNPVEFKVQEEEKIILNFALKNYAVSVTINPESFGTVEGSGVYKRTL